MKSRVGDFEWCFVSKWSVLDSKKIASLCVGLGAHAHVRNRRATAADSCKIASRPGRAPAPLEFKGAYHARPRPRKRASDRPTFSLARFDARQHIAGVVGEGGVVAGVAEQVIDELVAGDE